jgi:signal transduction histidine kinase
MNQLPIRKLTLYKQGIGYYERQGSLEGTTASLIVPRENINDTLKSMHIVDQRGGHVLGIDYETPADKETVLEELSIQLNDRSSMVDLLQSLRGSHIKLHLEDEESVTGRLIGIETSLEPSSHLATLLLQDESSPEDIHVHPINKLLGVSLQDERAATDVSFFLDVSQTEQTRITVTIRLSEGEHALEIAYLAPSPTWRVSYQLIGDDSNQARLKGWGIFDNRLDEDLEDVSLTLISGRPISFEYDLYESYVPSRPQVSDDPMAFESISNNPLVAESLSAISHEVRTPLNSIMGYARLLSEGVDGSLNESQQEYVKIIEKNSQRLIELINDLLAMSQLREGGRARIEHSAAFRYRSGPLGDLKVSSTYFMPMLIGNAEAEYLTYAVETPVSVRRKQSAMVPIVDHVISYQEICVYNGDKMPNHPLRVWQLQNSTGKALEQGPVTLIKEGQYLGEGLVRFTGVGDELQLPYALEFGIVVTEETSNGPSGILEVKFDSKKRRAVVSKYRVTEYNYTLTSHVEKEVSVYIERRDPNWGDYFEMPDPVLKVAGHTRWPVTVSANQETTFTVNTRTVQDREEDITKWDSDFVNSLHSGGLIEAEIYKSFESYWTELQREAETLEQSNTLQTEYNQLLVRQQQLRENLGALGKSGREEEIRNRILDDLELSENRRRELEAEIANLVDQIKQLQLIQQKHIDEIYNSSE